MEEEPHGGNEIADTPRDPYNTVASRIRNLLLIIMLSILIRGILISPPPPSLAPSAAP